MTTTPKRIRYLGGWEVYLNDHERTAAFFRTHGVDSNGFAFFKQIQAALELELEGNRIAKLYQHDQKGRRLIAENILLPINEWEDHPVFLLEKNPSGIHRMGGPKPTELVLPTHPDLSTPFQYIGTIDCADPCFEWLGMEKLHIVFPTLEYDAPTIYLDYSNPLEPQLISAGPFHHESDASEKELYVEYKQVHFTTSRTLDIETYPTNNALLCGVPLWYQCPDVPRDLVTGELMRFICNIESDPAIPIVNLKHPRYDFLMFGDMGHLMLFYNPRTKILCAYMEH